MYTRKFTKKCDSRRGVWSFCTILTGGWVGQSDTFGSTNESLKVKVKSLSRVRLFATPWTVAHQAPPSMGFSRQEYWSGLPFPSPGDLPNPGIKPRSPALQADALTSEPPGKTAVIFYMISLRFSILGSSSAQCYTLYCRLLKL